MRKIRPALLLFVLSVTLTATGWVDASASSTCTVSQQCPGWPPVSCTGPSGTCTTGSNYVECNGSRKTCPWWTCPVTVQCAYGGFIECNTTATHGYCEAGTDYVYCDGVGTLTCDECYPRFYCTKP